MATVIIAITATADEAAAFDPDPRIVGAAAQAEPERGRTRAVGERGQADQAAAEKAAGRKSRRRPSARGNAGRDKIHPDAEIASPGRNSVSQPMASANPGGTLTLDWRSRMFGSLVACRWSP